MFLLAIEPAFCNYGRNIHETGEPMKYLLPLFPIITTRYPNYSSNYNPYILNHLYKDMEAVQEVME
jgi:hypothetical protein